MAHNVFDNHENLQRKFGDLYCANHLMNRIEHDINNYIRKEVGIEFSSKIDTIGVEDYEDYLGLTIFVSNRDWETVFERVKEVFPGWDWYAEKGNNFSDIYLRLDDDVVASIPRFMFDE